MGLLTLSRIWQFADYQKMKDTVAALTLHSKKTSAARQHTIPSTAGDKKTNKYTNE